VHNGKYYYCCKILTFMVPTLDAATYIYLLIQFLLLYINQLLIFLKCIKKLYNRSKIIQKISSKLTVLRIFIN